MFNAMRQEAGVTEDFQFVAASFQAIFSHSEHHANSNNPAGTAQTLKKSDIIRIFDGDSSLLELGLNVLLRLAQSSFSLRYLLVLLLLLSICNLFSEYGL